MALTLTTEAQIKRLAGVGAPTAITSVSATLIEIGTSAEGEFCADTNRNWVADFSTINSYVKLKVARAVAARAAIEIVGNDDRGYTNLREQETLLDYLSDIYQQAVEQLSKADYNLLKSIEAQT